MAHEPTTPSRSRTPVPRVTIGVPVHNGDDYLAESLDSLLGQTFEDLEVVISDNASTDRTEAIARRYAELNPRVRYARSEVNRGVIWNFMRVIELARGEYFKWASHDDLCHPTFIARCVEVLDVDPTVVCCHTRTWKIDGQGRILVDLPDPTLASRGGASRRPSDRFRDVLLSTGYGARSYGVIRTAAMRRVDALMPVYGSEKVFMAELALHGRYHDIDEVLFYERVHPDASRALETAARQCWFVDPLRRGPRLPRLKLLGGYCRAVLRTPLPAGERLGCARAIAAYLFQVRKWHSIARSIVRGTGAVRHDAAEDAMLAAAIEERG